MYASKQARPYEDQKCLNDRRIFAAEEAEAGIVDAYPRKITVELTADCNAYCPHCWFTPPRIQLKKKDPHRNWHLPFADVVRFAEQVFPHIRYVNPTVVSEPLLYPQWGEFCGLLAQFGVELEMFTNASLLTPAECERILPVSHAIYVSMDGGTKKTFNRYRAGTDFDQVLGNVRLLNSLRGEGGPETWIVMTLMRGWAAELPEFLRIARDAGVDAVGVSHLISTTPKWKSESLINDEATCEPLFEETLRIAEEIGLPVFLPSDRNHRDRSYGRQLFEERRGGPSDPPQPEGGRIWCKYLWREAFVALNGDVAPCCGQHRPVVGNLQGFDLKDIWNNATMQSMRTTLSGDDRHPACATCPMLAHAGVLPYREEGFQSNDWPDDPLIHPSHRKR